MTETRWDFSKPDKKRFIFIAGPCVIEQEAATLKIARELRQIAQPRGVQFIFKASFDKANRSSADSFRGPGLKRGLEILARVKREVGVPVLSDVHELSQIESAAQVLDVLQIPAFLSRQTDLVLAAAASGRPVNIKKAQFTAPQDMGRILKKAAAKTRQILVTERGYTFGYNNLVVDMRSLAILREFGFPVIFDATHSIQLPGGGVQSGGEAKFIPVLARAAAAAGIDGMFMETHPDPKKAKSDSAAMIRLSEVAGLLDQVLAIHRLVRNNI